MDRLTEIFRMQRELMHHFMDIERRNGLLQTDQVPVNVESFAGQARLRDFAWRITEELAEAADTQVVARTQEELIDALHFLVELCILSGLSAGHFPPGDDEDRLGSLVRRDANRSGLIQVIASLGMTVNLLRNRPWKQQARLTEVAHYQQALGRTVSIFLSMCANCDLTAEAIFDEYQRKHAINWQRISEGL